MARGEGEAKRDRRLDAVLAQGREQRGRVGDGRGRIAVDLGETGVAAGDGVAAARLRGRKEVGVRVDGHGKRS